MTFQETAKIMAVFKAAYPRYYANIDVEEARRVTTLLYQASFHRQ